MAFTDDLRGVHDPIVEAIIDHPMMSAAGSRDRFWKGIGSGDVRDFVGGNISR